METIRIPDTIDGLPNLCGYEDYVSEATGRPGPFYLPESGIDFRSLQSGFACALHMHQPLIPAGGPDLESAPIISNLQNMMEAGSDGDRYNATVFHDCYKRLGTLIPELLAQGARPRIMLDYSGELLHGLIAMGLTDVIDALRDLTCQTHLRPCVEWLGTAWGHAVAPSTPVQDFRLHVQAWQHFFAALFGAEALSRVRGFSPSEMALPNHPDVAYAFVKTLRDCGYRWVLVQEHTIEAVDADGFDPYLPQRLVARNSAGESVSIIAVVKTQGSDTKLVAQMQPYYEAQGLSPRDLGGRRIPPLAVQIADGENGGVMMNEFPPKYREVMAAASDTAVAPVNVSEYLETLETLGVREADLPAVQPTGQRRLWERFTDGAGPAALADCIAEIRKGDDRFHMDGGSWTNDISWVRGYDNVLGPMQRVSARFAETMLAPGVPTQDPRYRRALFHLLLTQTSCFRYWGEGAWTDYGRELCRRALEALDAPVPTS